mmetsp:Transcript_37874/g.89629  ORF Transcript_37874/g.89629 Transcript_37874/m.89629 type:complete len:388 (+) Transcript_37874:55-1218(+)
MDEDKAPSASVRRKTACAMLLKKEKQTRWGFSGLLGVLLEKQQKDLLLLDLMDRGEVLVRLTEALGGLELLVARRRYGQRQPLVVSEEEGEAHVLLRVPEGERWRILFFQHVWALHAEHGVGEGTCVQHLQHLLPREAGRVGEGQPLREGCHHAPHHHVVHQLHVGARAHLPQEHVLLPHNLEAGHDGVVERLVARAEEHQRAVLGRLFAPSHRRFEEHPPLRPHRSSDCTAARRVDRGAVHIALAWEHGGCDLLPNGGGRRGVREHREDHVACGDERCGGRALRRARRDRRLTRGRRTVPHRHLEASGEEVFRHGHAHDALSNEPHRELLVLARTPAHPQRLPPRHRCRAPEPRRKRGGEGRGGADHREGEEEHQRPHLLLGILFR